MAAVYIETSAVLRWLLGQDRRDTVKNCLFESEHILTSTLTIIETERSVRRAVAMNVLTATEGDSLLEDFRSTAEGWIRMRITAAVENQAAKRYPVEPIRTLDAIHLATATLFIAAFPRLEILSFDIRVLSNAEALGFSAYKT